MQKYLGSEDMSLKWNGSVIIFFPVQINLFMSGKLLQEFIVDAGAITEQSHLT